MIFTNSIDSATMKPMFGKEGKTTNAAIPEKPKNDKFEHERYIPERAQGYLDKK